MVSSNISTNMQEDAVNFLSNKLPSKINVVVLLGTGWHNFLDLSTILIDIPYTDIPHISDLAKDNINGHLICATYKEKTFLVLHDYADDMFVGHNSCIATLIINSIAKLGVTKMLVTCTAGSLNDHYLAGEMMLIIDHVNFTSESPNVWHKPKNTQTKDYDTNTTFPTLFDIYDTKLQELAEDIAITNRIRLCKGIYAGISSPAYATRSTLKMLSGNKCDAVGMSIINEVTVGAYNNMQILALCALTSMTLPHASIYSSPTHLEHISKNAVETFKKFVAHIIPNL